jgi:hypothetical protein
MGARPLDRRPTSGRPGSGVRQRSGQRGPARRVRLIEQDPLVSRLQAPVGRAHGRRRRPWCASSSRSAPRRKSSIWPPGARIVHRKLVEGTAMPEQRTLQRARRDKRKGKSPSTQAGEFVREEIHHVREAKHGAASAKQAIAIGLSKARRAGVDLPPPKTGSARTKKQAARESAAGRRKRSTRKSTRRARASLRRLRREGRSAASHRALARQARKVARRRGARARSRSAKRAAKTRRAGR